MSKLKEKYNINYMSLSKFLTPRAKNNMVNPANTAMSSEIAPIPTPLSITALNASFA